MVESSNFDQTRKGNLQTLIKTAEENASKHKTAESIISVVEPLIRGLTAELKRLSSEAVERKTLLLECINKYKNSAIFLRECESKLEPFHKK